MLFSRYSLQENERISPQNCSKNLQKLSKKKLSWFLQNSTHKALYYRNKLTSAKTAGLMALLSSSSSSSSCTDAIDNNLNNNHRNKTSKTRQNNRKWQKPRETKRKITKCPSARSTYRFAALQKRNASNWRALVSFARSALSR